MVIYRSLVKKGPLGGAPYKSAKEGGGALSAVSAFNHERAPSGTSCLQRLSKPSKQIIAHKITYNGITSGFKIGS